MNLKTMRSHIRAKLMRVQRDVSQLGPQSEWTDAELNAIINQAYRQFLMDTEVLRDTSDVTFTAGKGTMPDGVIEIKRIEIDGDPIGTLTAVGYEGELPV